MTVPVAKFSNPRQRSLPSTWLLLFLASPVLSSNYPSVYIPSAVGIPSNGRNHSLPFGAFGTLFNYCGKYTTDQLNEQFPYMRVPTSNDYVVQCNPSPTRVIVAVAGNADFGKFQRDLKKECELFTCSANDYPAVDSNLGNITNGPPGSNALAPSPETASITVCNGKKAQYPEGSTGNILFANENKCQEEHKPLQTAITSAQTFVQLPRWIQKDEDRFDLRTLYYRGEDVNHMVRVPYVFNQLSTMQGSYQQCDTTCDIGQLVKLNMNPGSFSLRVFVTGSCSSMKVCFNPEGFLNDTRVPECHPDRQIDIMIASGAVVWKKNGRASLIELRSEYHDDGHPLAIEVGYGVKVGNILNSEFYVGNDHREFVSSDTKGFKADEASKLAFFFSDEKCLVPTAGIFSKNIQTGKTLSTKKPQVIGSTYNQQGQPITGPQNETATTTTADPIIYNIPQTTTAAPVVAVPQGVPVDILDSNTGSHATFVLGKWWTWGIYFGFICGTLLTTSVGGGIFYLTRRTVFGIWYRGMYRRYGCDVSSTTAGLTGVGFGETTALTQTVGATTGGGTTGGGTMFGSTEGATAQEATDASSRTNMLDKTGTGTGDGTRTLAM